MVAVFDEVRRVLHESGTCWVNMGDSYAQTTCRNRNGAGNIASACKVAVGRLDNERSTVGGGMKQKDLMLVPWQLALAMRAAGWFLRDAIVWHKPAPMPESCRDRCTKAWEPIFMFARSKSYYADMEAVKQPFSDARNGNPGNYTAEYSTGSGRHDAGSKNKEWNTNGEHSGANLRNVWTLSPEAYKGKHFATFPSELPRRCIMIGTSAKGVCPTCLAPWRRVVERDRVPTRPGTNWKGAQEGSPLNEQTSGYLNVDPQRHCTETKTTGWERTCTHEHTEADTIAATVLDPFSGTATTGVVANSLGRDYIGLDISDEYLHLAQERCGGLFLTQGAST